MKEQSRFSSVGSSNCLVNNRSGVRVSQAAPKLCCNAMYGAVVEWGRTSGGSDFREVPLSIIDAFERWDLFK